MLRQLDLTSAQHTQVKAIFAKEKPAMEPLMQQMRQNHDAMKALEAAGPSTKPKTRALATQNSQTMIELQVEHARIKSEIMQILTADQKTKLAQIEANREARMKSTCRLRPRLTLLVSLQPGWGTEPPTSVLARLFHPLFQVEKPNERADLLYSD